MSFFQFKYFKVQQSHAALKVGTDALLLGALCELNEVRRVLDVGTGTGVISLMIAQRVADCQIDAIDIDALSLVDCAFNFKQSNWSSKLNAIESDFMVFQSKAPYDLIISNPPFYLNGLLGDVARVNVAKHAEHFSFEVFFEQAILNLSVTGTVWIIVPAEHVTFIQLLAKRVGLYTFRVIHIFPTVEKPSNRAVLGFSKLATGQIETDFVLRNKNGTYTSEYKQLTAEFHDRTLP